MTMKTLDSKMWQIMDATADDWESIEQIHPHVLKYHGTVSSNAIYAALKMLHADGLIKVMDNTGSYTELFPNNPSNSWFTMTEKGRDLWNTERGKYEEKG